MRLMLKAAPVLLVLFSAGQLHLRADEVDHYIEDAMRRLHLPGLALGVVKDGTLIKAQGYGVADLELSAPVTPDTVFEIGSNTKQFTAAAIMMLVEEGKLRLDDSISRYFPEVPEAWRAITIRHVLSHTSGIQNHVAVPGYLSVFKTDLLGGTSPRRDELLSLFFQLPLEFEPGETWAYDNTGYYLLGLIIEKVSGISYWQFLGERIFKPLGMSSTRNTNSTPIVPNRASGYEWVNDHYENRPVLAPFVAFSAGSLLSTVRDLAKWDSALRTETLLKKDSLAQMWQPAKTRDGAPPAMNYGFGWFTDVTRGHRMVLHNGGTPGFSSVIHRYINDRLAVIILTNHSDRLLDQLAVDVAGLLEPSLRRANPVSEDPDPVATERVRAALSGMQKGQPEMSLFTVPMQLFLKSATGKGLGQWFGIHGQIDSLALSETDVDGVLRVLRYRVVLGGNPYWFTVKLTPEGRIAQICWP